MKILIFGSNGLVGSSLLRNFKKNKNFDVYGATRNDANLFSFDETNNFIKNQAPDVVINAAAKVGGIVANNTNRTEFILENLKINMNILESLVDKQEVKLINLGSSCIYPLDAPNPISESSLMKGPLEPTNSPYAMAKLTAIELGDALSKQHGNTVINLMPTNLYGPNDNFSETSSHVIPGLMSRLHKAKANKEKVFKVWGTGKPKREFLHVDDLSDSIEFLITKNHEPSLINVGSGEEVTIAELVKILNSIIQFEGDIKFDTTMPDGNPRKLLDSTSINELGWNAKISLSEGLKNTYNWYLENK